MRLIHVSTGLVRGLAACAFAVALTGCGSSNPSGPAPTKAHALDGTVDWSAIHGTSHIYLLVNTDGSKHYEVERVDLVTGSSRLITQVPGSFGVSMFSVSRAGLVVAAAPNNLSQVEKLKSDGALKPVKNSDDAAAALINSQGDLALYVRAPEHVGIAIRKAGSGHASPPVAIGDHDSVFWSGDAAVLLLSSRPGRTVVRTLDVNGRVQSKVRQISGVHWTLGASINPGGPVLLGSKAPRPGLLWWPSSNKTTPIAAGWSPGCVSPDGKQVLVTKGRQIGVIATAKPTSVTSIGELPNPTLQCGWVTKSYGAK